MRGILDLSPPHHPCTIRHKDGRPQGIGHLLADESKSTTLRLGTYPAIDPKKQKRGRFTGEICENSVVLPPARRATGTQIPARRGPQPRLEIPLRDFPDSGVVRVRVRASTIPGSSNTIGPVEVCVYPLLPDGDLASYAQQLPTQTLFTSDFDLRKLSIQIEKTSLKFATLIEIPTSGKYTFFTKADDGSRLYVDGDLIVNGESVNRDRDGSVDLKAGQHELIVTYYDTGGGDSLTVEWQGPDFERQPIPASALVAPTPEEEPDEPESEPAWLTVMMANRLDDGVEFEAEIPPFTLAMPRALH